MSSLVQARAIARRRELAVRVALGANRFRIVRQMLTEGMLLALAGLAFGLAPALTSSRPDLNETLKATGRSAAGGSAQRLRSALVVSEMALALVLLAGAGLLIESARRLGQTDAGFNPARLLTAQLNLPEAAYPAPERKAEFARRLLDRLSSLPGVRAAAAASSLPLLGWSAPQAVEIAGRPARSESDFLRVSVKTVTPEYFDALGVAIRAGSPAAAVVDLALARTLCGGGAPPQAAVGKRIRVGNGPWRTVVGVADDVKQALDQPVSGEILVSHYQDPGPALSLLPRTSGDPKLSIASLRRELRDLDRDLPVSDIRTMEEIIRNYYPRVMFAGLGIFATVALALAALGLYGVVSFLVAQRTRKIGIRITLGAGRSSVLRLVPAQAFRLAAIGVTIGLAGAFALARVLSQFLYGVWASDPAVFAAVAVTLFAVALVAAYLPARRAARIVPAVSLRYE